MVGICMVEVLHMAMEAHMVVLVMVLTVVMAVLPMVMAVDRMLVVVAVVHTLAGHLFQEVMGITLLHRHFTTLMPTMITAMEVTMVAMALRYAFYTFLPLFYFWLI